MSATLEAALDKSGQPVKRGTMAHDHHVYMLLTESAASRRDAADLARYAPRLAELAERDNHRLYRAIALRAQGVAERLTGSLDEARAHLNQALEDICSAKDRLADWANRMRVGRGRTRRGRPQGRP